MRRHPNAKYNAPEKRKRLTMPSMRQQPSLSERTARYKKHASLKTSSEESESSKNNFKKMFKASKEKLRNHSQKRTEGRRTDSPAPNKDTENNAKNFPSRREPAHLGRSEIRASPMKTQGGRYLRDNRQRREEKQEEGETKRIDEEEKQKHRGVSLEDERVVRSWLAKKDDGPQKVERTRIIQDEITALMEQRDRLREKVWSEREEQKRLLEALESKESELEEAKRDLRKQDSFIDKLNSNQQELLQQSFKKIKEKEEKIQELVTKNSKLKKDKDRLREELEVAQRALSSKDETKNNVERLKEDNTRLRDELAKAKQRKET